MFHRHFHQYLECRTCMFSVTNKLTSCSRGLPQKATGPQLVKEYPANIWNKQSWTADKGWYFKLGVGRCANNSSPSKPNRVSKRSQKLSSLNIIRVIKSRMRWAGHIACTFEIRGAYRIWVGKPEGRRAPERSRRRWKDNIKINLGEVGF